MVYLKGFQYHMRCMPSAMPGADKPVSLFNLDYLKSPGRPAIP